MEGKKESFDLLAQSLRSMNDAVYSYVTQNPKISQSVIGQLEHVVNQTKGIRQSPIAKSDIKATMTVPSNKLFNRLSYTHFVQFLPIEDPLERTFYEIECIKGVWSTREVKRQIDSGISSDKDKAKAIVEALIAFDLKNQYAK